MPRNRSQVLGWVDVFRPSLRAAVKAGMLLVICIAPSRGQDCDYAVRVWETGHGLPQGPVTWIVLTPDNHLWLATLNEVTRFDGAGFTLFDEEDAPALQNNRLIRLGIDHEGERRRISQDGSPRRFQAGRFKILTALVGLPEGRATAVAPGPKGSLLLLGYGLMGRTEIQRPQIHGAPKATGQNSGWWRQRPQEGKRP